MSEFYVSPSFIVPVREMRLGGKQVDTEKLKQFWATASSFRDKRGCYVFSMRAAQGELPFYVGKATKQSFEDECFSVHKRGDHYNPVLGTRRGTPRLTFVVQQKVRGRWSAVAIDDLEEYLIARAAKRNKDLTNSRRLPSDTWSIRGVIGSGSGKPSAAANSFKKLFKISDT